MDRIGLVDYGGYDNLLSLRRSIDFEVLQSIELELRLCVCVLWCNNIYGIYLSCFPFALRLKLHRLGRSRVNGHCIKIISLNFRLSSSLNVIGSLTVISRDRGGYRSLAYLRNGTSLLSRKWNRGLGMV